MSGGVMPGGSCFSQACDTAVQLAHRQIDVGTLMEEVLDDRHAGQRLGFDMVDIVDGRQRHTFETARNPAAHLLGRQSVIGPDDTDHRNAEFGKMSFAVLTIESGPRMSSSSASTIKVYGRLSATLTIHIQLLLRFRLQNRSRDPHLGGLVLGDLV